jgi:hypothetical protein
VGRTDVTWARRGRALPRLASIASLAALLVACGPDDTPTVREITPGAAYTAIVLWEAEQQVPVLDDNGEARLPVVYVVGASDAPIDVAVQAEVVQTTVDTAVVRFADSASEAFDSRLDDQPVLEQGSMLLVGEIPEAARVLTVDVVRYLAADDAESLELEITARAPRDDGITARVTSATSASQP